MRVHANTSHAFVNVTVASTHEFVNFEDVQYIYEQLANYGLSFLNQAFNVCHGMPLTSP